MDLGIRGRKAIVAGGSAGMGRGAALALAREGVEIVLSARGETRLRAAAAEITNETGVQVTPVVADHATAAGRHTLLAACPEPDILIATISPPAMTPDFRAISEADWLASFASGMIGPAELMRGVVDGMAERQFGRIVNISTVAAKHPIELRLLSGAARSALANYTAVVARRMARHNVTVNNLLPGLFLTDRLAETFAKDAAETGVDVEVLQARYIERWRIPAGRLGDPDDFGKVAALMCGAFANFIDGPNLIIDGGAATSLF